MNQSNRSGASSSASNSNTSDQSITQDQASAQRQWAAGKRGHCGCGSSAGEQEQSSWQGQEADNKVDQEANSTAWSLTGHQSNWNGGGNGDVSQSNSSGARSEASNRNDSTQSIGQGQTSRQKQRSWGGRRCHCGGGSGGQTQRSSQNQDAENKVDQEANSTAYALTGHQRNVNGGRGGPAERSECGCARPSHGGGGDVDQSNEAGASSSARNQNTSDQAIVQVQEACSGSEPLDPRGDVTPPPRRRIHGRPALAAGRPPPAGVSGTDSRLALVISRYSRADMDRVWSEQRKLERWLEVELAALDAWAELGRVPEDAAREIRARAGTPTPERVQELEARTHHDVAAFVDAVAEELGEHGRWFHYGLTSSDVLDTALALQVQEAGRLILEGVERSFAAVVRRADEHRQTLTIGRTHGVHAEPTTFGLKLAGWAFELERDRVRLERAFEGLRVGKLSGAVGTYSATDPDVERVACERLGLEPAPSSTQILQRDRHAELLAALAVTAASLEKFALEVRHLARTEVREVEEPFGHGQKGSSAMPHKRNPIVAERICGLARVVRAGAIVGLEDVALWHERDISHSSAERVVLPDAFLALDYMLDRFAWLVEGLVVVEERMWRNLEASHFLFFSQRVLLALVEGGLSRAEAYRLVQRNAMHAWEEEQDFRELVRSDSELAGRLELDELFSLAPYTRHVDTIFDRLHALVRAREEEPTYA